MSDFTPIEPMNRHNPTPIRRRKPSKPYRGPMRWILLAAMLVAFSYVYIGGNYGWYRMWELKKQKSQLELEISVLEARRFDLTGELNLLNRNPETDPQLRLKMERKAREENGMVRKDEMIYRFKSETQGTGNREPETGNGKASDP